ncbi:MAG: exodeoxyribonuclease VII small subunit [Candidatus Methanomethylophilaceae archaeon]|jgi:exodeoxyribonuclease VII small subunit
MNEDIEKMSFEECITALEELVKELESGNLDLDKSLEVYERATVLRDRCKKILEESERRVQKITESSEGIKRSDLKIE